ncbi:putative photosystem II Psb28, class 1 [Helianthus debilis subsp. tardiflorus]
MATLQTIAFSSPLSHHSPQQPLRLLPGMKSGTVWHSSRSSFSGQALTTPISRLNRTLKTSRAFTLTIQMVKPTIQFIPGRDEQTIPDVKLTKSRDGTNGMAIFRFDQPSVFDSSGEVGDITGFYMIDDEGTLQSVDVSAKFVNGRPAGIEAKYVMRTPKDWDRFMRFMERYANVNGLQFVKS